MSNAIEYLTSIEPALNVIIKNRNGFFCISLLEKSDIQKSTISNILRRLGMDDVKINNSLNMADEQKLASESGRIYEAIIDFD